MKKKQITTANADGLMRRLYETAFPEGEQIPWDDLLRLVEDMPLDFTAYYDEKDFIGFTIVFPTPSYNWFWYFAVREELRGNGLGQQILTQLIEHYKGQTFVLDIEAIKQQIPSKSLEESSDKGQNTSQTLNNLEQRKRRHFFYLRNGFRDTCLYRTYNDIIMTIMMRGDGTFTMKDWDNLVGELKRFWWPDDISESREFSMNGSS